MLGPKVCYKTSNAASHIQATFLFVYTSPVQMDTVADITSRTSTTFECYTLSGLPLPVTGALQLLLNMIFVDTAHVISISSVAVHFQ